MMKRFMVWIVLTISLPIILISGLSDSNAQQQSQSQVPPPARTKKLNIVKTGQMEKDGLITNFYQFGSRRCEFLVELLTVYKSEKGIIKVYPELGILTITDTKEKTTVMDEVLNIIDAPEPQITIESQIVDLSLDKDLQYGGEATLTRPDTNGGNMVIDEAKINLNPEDYLQQLLNFQGGTASFLDSKGAGTFNLVIRAMARKGKADIKSNPKLTVINGEQATLITGQDFPYVAASTLVGNNVQSTVAYKEVGIELKVIPFFVGRDTIELSVSPSVSVVTSQVQIGGAGVPVVAKRGITTKVNVKSGETLVIGGLLRDETLTSERKVPLLGDIPFLGMFFKSEREQKYKSELLFLITPRLVETMNAEPPAPSSILTEPSKETETSKKTEPLKESKPEEKK